MKRGANLSVRGDAVITWEQPSDRHAKRVGQGVHAQQGRIADSTLDCADDGAIEAGSNSQPFLRDAILVPDVPHCWRSSKVQRADRE